MSSASVWPTVLAGGLGTAGTLSAAIITQWRAGKGEVQRARYEEMRLMNLEGRAAVADCLAVSTLLMARWADGDREISKLFHDLQVAVARVQITCSEKVANQAMMLELVAEVMVKKFFGDDPSQAREDISRMKKRQQSLINDVRNELGLEVW